MIVERHGRQLLAARVHIGNHVHLFVFALPKVCVPELVRVFKCVSVKILFDVFSVEEGLGWAFVV